MPLLPSSALAWTYFERDDENFVCKKGSYNGTCKPCAAGWLCKDESHEAYLNEKCSLREIKECMEGCSNGRCNPCRPGPKCIDLFTLGVLDENCNWTEIIHCDPYGYCWADRCQSHPTLATPNPPASNAPQAAQRQPTEQQAISAEETGFAAVTTITQNMPAQPTQTETGSEAQTIVKTQPETIWQANEVQTALETGQPIARAAESAESPAALAALVQNTANAIAAGIAAVFAWVAGLLFK